MRTLLFLINVISTFALCQESATVIKKTFSDGSEAIATIETEEIKNGPVTLLSKLNKGELVAKEYSGKADVVTLTYASAEGKRQTIRKYYSKLYDEMETGYNEIGGFGNRFREFKIFDIAKDGIRLFVFVVYPNHAALQIFKLDEADTSKNLEQHIFLSDGVCERGGIFPFQFAQVTPTRAGAYILLIADSGKHSLWEVSGRESKMVWSKTDGTIVPERQEKLRKP